MVAITLKELGGECPARDQYCPTDKIAEQTLEKLGAEAAFKGYNGFPLLYVLRLMKKSYTVSQQKAKSGDIISIDMGAG